MFWDGSRWIDERSTTPAPSGSHRTRDRIATIPILLLIPALLFPFLTTTAAVAPAISTAGVALDGHTLAVSGNGFQAGIWVRLQWDGSSSGMPTVRVGSDKRLAAAIKVPAAAKLGNHVLTAVGAYWAWNTTRSGAMSIAAPGHTVLASTTVTVTTPAANAAAQTPAVTAPPVVTAPPAAPPTPTAAPVVLPDPTPSPTVAPTSPPTAAPAPTPVPTPVPTPDPTPVSTPPPASGNAWSVPFLGRTASGAILVSGQHNVTVSGKQFVNLPAGQDAIVVQNSSNVTITANDFSGNTGDIYVVDSSNVTITWNRYRNVGDGTIGSGHSNFIQFSRTTGGYIAHNKGIGGDTEDIISMFQSQGASAASPIVIEDNAFEGTNWSSGSGSGSMLGDAGGSHIVVRDNTFLNPGQVGIGVSGGSDIHVLNNVLYGAQRAGSNVGIYVWNQSGGSCSAIEVSGNSVHWYQASGAENPYWDGSNCGTVAGVGTNNWHASIDPATLHVTL